MVIPTNCLIHYHGSQARGARWPTVHACMHALFSHGTLLCPMNLDEVSIKCRTGDCSSCVVPSSALPHLSHNILLPTGSMQPFMHAAGRRCACFLIRLVGSTRHALTGRLWRSVSRTGWFRPELACSFAFPLLRPAGTWALRPSSSLISSSSSLHHMGFVCFESSFRCWCIRGRVLERSAAEVVVFPG